MVEAMVYILRTGCPWRDIPDHFGPWSSKSLIDNSLMKKSQNVSSSKLSINFAGRPRMPMRVGRVWRPEILGIGRASGVNQRVGFPALDDFRILGSLSALKFCEIIFGGGSIRDFNKASPFLADQIDSKRKKQLLFGIVHTRKDFLFQRPAFAGK